MSYIVSVRLQDGTHLYVSEVEDSLESPLIMSSSRERAAKMDKPNMLMTLSLVHLSEQFEAVQSTAEVVP